MKSNQDLDTLCDSHEYADYILANVDQSDRIICNGDTLLEAMEALYLFDEFVESLNGKAT